MALQVVWTPHLLGRRGVWYLFIATAKAIQNMKEEAFKWLGTRNQNCTENKVTHQITACSTYGVCWHPIILAPQCIWSLFKRTNDLYYPRAYMIEQWGFTHHANDDFCMVFHVMSCHKMNRTLAWNSSIPGNYPWGEFQVTWFRATLLKRLDWVWDLAK